MRAQTIQHMIQNIPLPMEKAKATLFLWPNFVFTVLVIIVFTHVRNQLIQFCYCPALTILRNFQLLNICKGHKHDLLLRNFVEQVIHHHRQLRPYTVFIIRHSCLVFRKHTKLHIWWDFRSAQTPSKCAV